jgi:hypothetical protein
MKALTKGERKLSFEQFERALELLANIKFPNDKEGVQKIVGLAVKVAPSTSGTLPVSGGIVGKLTDTSLYTGTHKERFDAEGVFISLNMG